MADDPSHNGANLALHDPLDDLAAGLADDPVTPGRQPLVVHHRPRKFVTTISVTESSGVNLEDDLVPHGTNPTSCRTTAPTILGGVADDPVPGRSSPWRGGRPRHLPPPSAPLVGAAS